MCSCADAHTCAFVLMCTVFVCVHCRLYSAFRSDRSRCSRFAHSVPTTSGRRSPPNQRSHLACPVMSMPIRVLLSSIQEQLHDTLKHIEKYIKTLDRNVSHQLLRRNPHEPKGKCDLKNCIQNDALILHSATTYISSRKQYAQNYVERKCFTLARRVAPRIAQTPPC
ncbi:hypothetical protein F2P81_015004 [Scophthalmus maximus]|uniref:Uncharacterized protein n=1 Tax=Scophthalmus maximus TaxID=52904 RepID=A0A6A4SNN4_SCOMX|nr:hypothetical protein F2P81_015004 [Scophthalmus maximus]